MKKILKILLIVIAALLLLLITIPMIFKNKIEQVVKEKVNENIHAVVDWNQFGINFFRGFPSLSVNLKGMSVTGLEPFEGDTLAGFERFELRVKPFSAIKGDLIVEAIILNRPLINGIVLADSSANWDIIPPSDEITEEETEEQTGGLSKGLQLKRFSIIEGRIFYHDMPMNVVAEIQDFNLDLKGDFSLDQSDMELLVKASAIDAEMGGIRYLRDAEFELSLVAGADLVNSVYTLRENEIRLNGLILGASGSLAMPENGDMQINLDFHTKETTFKTLLSLVPAIYLQDFESIRTDGTLQLEGSVNGVLNESRTPDATLNLVVNNGYFSYPDLPKDVKDIQIKVDVNYNGLDQDLTTIDLTTFHLEIAGNPIDLQLHIATPMSDMSVRGAAKGMVDFASLADVVPMEDIELGGTLETDIRINTKMSYIEREDYENVDVEGNLVISDVLVKTPDLPDPVDLKTVDMEFSPKFVSLNKLDLSMGSSDLHLTGKLSNFIPYVFEGKTVSGELSVNSGLLDLNPFLPEKDTTEKESADSTLSSMPDTIQTGESVKIPQNIDFRMKMAVNKILYDNITIENMAGYINVHEGIATLEELSLDVLDGKLLTNGTVDTRDELTHVNVGLNVKDIDIPRSYETFVTVEKLAPMAQYCKGQVSTKMKYESFLNASFEPVYESINADGNLWTRNLQVYNLKSFVRLSELLKSEKFRNMMPDDVNVAFRVLNGRIIVEPFDVKFDNSKMKVSGSHGIDMTMDYNIDMNIAKKDLGTGANEMLTGITALAAGAGVQIQQSDYIKVKAHIGGTFNDPDVITDLSENLKGMTQSVEKQVKERVEEEVQQKVEEVRKTASEEAEKIIRDAEAEAARIIEQAEKTGEDLVREAEKQGNNLIKEAGNNPLKKLAAQKAADELKNQAEKQSANLVADAQKKADDIIARAKEEAAKIDQ